MRCIQFFEVENAARHEMGKRGFDFMLRSYDVKESYHKIMQFIK
jgi:hypothetical protein